MSLRGLCPLIVIFAQHCCHVQQAHAVTSPVVGSLESRWSLASMAPQTIGLGTDSLPLLTMDPETFERRASSSELLWIEVQEPILYYLTPAQLNDLIDAHRSCHILSAPRQKFV